MKITRKDIAAMLMQLKVLYPYAWKETTEEETKLVVDTWLNCFKNYSKKLVEFAFSETLRICPVPPTIADILEIINRIDRLKEKKAEVFWAEFEEYLTESQSVENQYDEKLNEELWKNLPEELKLFCGGYNMFLRIAEYSNEQLYFERKRFLKEYQDIRDEKILKQRLKALKLSDGAQIPQIVERG